MLNITIKILIIILFVLLPLMNSHLIDLFWIKWGFYVAWNYEFTKVIFFNILSWIIFSLFFIKSFLNKNKIIIPNIAILLSIILILSSIFSLYFLNKYILRIMKMTLNIDVFKFNMTIYSIN